MKSRKETNFAIYDHLQKINKNWEIEEDITIIIKAGCLKQQNILGVLRNKGLLTKLKAKSYRKFISSPMLYSFVGQLRTTDSENDRNRNENT